MQLKKWSSLYCLMVLAALARAVLADPPATWEVAYGIHETPTNAASPIDFRVTLSLRRAGQSGSSISWRVDSIKIERDGTGDIWTEARSASPAITISAICVGLPCCSDRRTLGNSFRNTCTTAGNA